MRLTKEDEVQRTLIYKQCYSAVLRKGANRKKKHLNALHADLYKEFGQVGDSSSFSITEALNKMA